MSKLTALITGITGQDGSYLAELLLSKGYEVHGTVRRSSSGSTSRIAHLLDQVFLHDADLLDQECLTRLVSDIVPGEVYNLAAQSFVPVSWEQPILTSEVTGLGCLRLLEALRSARLLNSTKFYQASSSEMFGRVTESPQSENTPFHPRSPYGVSKCYAHYMTQNYRESYGLFACSGILFNHESPRRGFEFVTRKVTSSVARIKLGLQDNLELGNLHAYRDWGHARDYVKAMWLMLQADKPEDYVVATDIKHSVRDLVVTAFECVGLDWSDYVNVNPSLKRPAEVWTLQGDYSNINRTLGWEPEISFDQLIKEMVSSDLALLNK